MSMPNNLTCKEKYSATTGWDDHVDLVIFHLVSLQQAKTDFFEQKMHLRGIFRVICTI